MHGVNRKIVKGTIIATLIAVTPYIFYLHESVPNTKVWNTFLFTYESKWYENANLAMWFYTMKAVPLLLITIWFFTCRHWWYHAIIVPICMYSFQLTTAFLSETDRSFDDKLILFYLVPVMAVVIPSIYLVRAKMFNKLNDANKTMEELEEEFKLKPKSFFKRFSDYF